MTQLTVSIEDVSMLDQIKQAVSLIRGVSSVTLKRRRKTSMDRAIEDIEQGRVYSECKQNLKNSLTSLRPAPPASVFRSCRGLFRGTFCNFVARNNKKTKRL